MMPNKPNRPNWKDVVAAELVVGTLLLIWWALI